MFDPGHPLYKSTYAEEVKDLNTPAATKVLTSTVVATGEIWIVKVATVFDQTSAPTALRLYASISGVTVFLGRVTAPGAAIPLVWNGELALAAGDSVSGEIFGPTLNDDTYLYVAGYKMYV